MQAKQHPPVFSEADGLDHEPDEMVLVGPPGTGKTRAVLEHFLLPAVERWPVGTVLGCSFTRAAAVEMRERLEKRTNALTDAGLKLTCSTIHSEAFRLCRKAGFKTLWKQARPEDSDEPRFDGWEALSEQQSDRREEAERLWMLARHLRPQDLLAPAEEYSRSQVAGLLSRSYGLLGDSRSRWTFEELVTEVLVYEADKRADGAVDFCDMLGFALRLPFPERELLVVDEAQDLSPLQIALVRRWASSSKRLVWVGDPDQGIFRFAGADGGALTALMLDGRVRTRRLAQSYRVPRAAHEAAREVILRNRARVDAPYEPAAKAGSIAHHFDGGKALREAVLSQGTVFVLGRTARALDPYAQVLVEAGEPFARERGGSSPMRKETLITVVVAIHDLRDRLSLLGPVAVTLCDSLKAGAKGTRFRETKKASMGAIRALAETEEYISRREMERAGVLLGPILETKSIEESLGVIGLREEAEPLLRIVRRHGIGALAQEPRITLTTMHTSKGREAETVLVDLQAPAPCRRAVAAADQAAVEDERRVLYVALTRTKDRLVLRHYEGSEDLLCLLG